MLTQFLRGCILALCFFAPIQARAAEESAVSKTIDGLIDRMQAKLRPFELRYLSDREVTHFLTPPERRILSTGHVSFRINIPVTVYIARGQMPRHDPFWLRERGFNKSSIEWNVERASLKVWEREFEPGTVGLGINSFVGGGGHYMVAVAPKFPGDAVIISDLYPTNLVATDLKVGTKLYVDREASFPAVPGKLVNCAYIQTSFELRDDARVRDVFRWTDHRSDDSPDQIILTWSGDPKTTQTIQWRTAERIRNGVVRFSKRTDAETRAVQPLQIPATTERLHTKFVVNDSIVRRHTVTLTNLEPGTTYRYSVGDGTPRGWSATSEFTTAPAGDTPFSFIYMGDAQTGLYRWGGLLRDAQRAYPDAAFYIIAGDLVNRGHERDDWDAFFYNTRGVFDRRTFIPALGNHDCMDGHPTLYLSFFELPRNGPPKIEHGRVYSYEYGNALFVILDSNLAPETQTQWLEQVLTQSKSTWKFVTFHHPVYSSKPERDNKKIREAWSPIFEKHNVDLVLQGHDHAYLRTSPLRDGNTVDSPAKGPIYLVAVSGSKMYDQHPRDYTAFGMTNVPTYQIFNIAGKHLTYRAHDSSGRLRDQFAITKE